MDNILSAALSQTNKVLIGLGEEWSYNYKNISNDIAYKNVLDEAKDGYDWLIPFIQYHYIKSHEDLRKEAFEKLSDLIKDKDYFIVSICIVNNYVVFEIAIFGIISKHFI